VNVPKKKKTIDFYEILEDNFSEFVVKTDDNDPKISGVIPTGVTSLDVSIGIGGIPLNRLTEIYGGWSCGKTTLDLNIVKNALDLGYNALYVDPEQGVDVPFARGIIGDLVDNKDRFVLTQPRTMEQSLGLCEAGIRSKNFNLVILDSIGSMAPQKVFDDELDDANVAILARRMNVFLERNAFEVKYNNIAFVGINQVRDVIGAYVHTTESPGGWQWKHITSLRIELTKMGGKEGVIMQGEEKIGIQTKFVIKKSKVSAPFRAFYFPIMFKGGIDKVRDLVEFASTMGILVGSYYSFEGKTTANGFNNTVEAIRQDPELFKRIVEKCYGSINVGIVEEETIDELSITS
jgi:recombination protein RecA